MAGIKDMSAEYRRKGNDWRKADLNDEHTISGHSKKEHVSTDDKL